MIINRMLCLQVAFLKFCSQTVVHSWKINFNYVITEGDRGVILEKSLDTLLICRWAKENNNNNMSLIDDQFSYFSYFLIIIFSCESIKYDLDNTED